MFNRKISYASMSVAEMLRSPHETELMLIAEKYIENGNYGIALQLLPLLLLPLMLLLATDVLLLLPLMLFINVSTSI